MKRAERSVAFAGKHVLPVGIGTHGHGHAFGGITHEESVEILRRVCDRLPPSAQVLIDTAPRYGHGVVESWLGSFLEAGERRCLIATKGGRHIEPDRDNQKDFTREFLERDLEGSLTRLKIKGVFLYQLHNPSIDTIERGEVFDVVEGFRDKGLIQWYGVSIDEPIEGLAVINTCRRKGLSGLASLQVIYSVIAKHGRNTLFRAAADAGIAIIAREVLTRGFLTDKYRKDSNFLDAPSAVRKLIRQYGAEQLIARAQTVRGIAARAGVTTAQLALCFATHDPFVTVTLAGINRLRYLDEDWAPQALSVSSDLLLELHAIPDAVPFGTSDHPSPR